MAWEDGRMKKVLLLGDSIRISYQLHVREALQKEAEFVWPDENCRYAKYTLWGANEWITQLGRPDIIHWNNGIWDIYRLNDDIGIFTDLDWYIHDIARVLRELKKTGAQIIWATTTPVDSRNVNCRNEDIDAYNEKAAELMNGEGIAIDDLNAVVKQNIGLFIGGDRLHLSPEGERACADAVAESIRKHLQA
jgi:hypothetical protein